MIFVKKIFVQSKLGEVGYIEISLCSLEG